MDLPSDSDESDVDFIPDEKHCSDDDDDGSEIETEECDIEKGNKRSSSSKLGKSHNKKLKINENESKDESLSTTTPIDEKKHEDDLWAAFLTIPEGEKSKKCENSTEKVITSSCNTTNGASNSTLAKNSEHVSKRLCDETVEPVSRELLDSSKIQNNKNSKVLPIIDVVSNIPVRKKFGFGVGGGSSGSGLSSVLNKIGKNSKLSTLEKSKLDWNTFKKEEGIEEDISIYNRGRAGYLERQDFLQRTDLRQFEIEKDLRTTKRSNR